MSCPRLLYELTPTTYKPRDPVRKSIIGPLTIYRVKMNFSVADTSAVNLTMNLSSKSNTESGSAKNGCIYCLAKVIHPRLGRGESYACGYKPYRCEICNYSTVTKGNLAIHEQSDRHLNNIQVKNSSTYNDSIHNF